MEWAETPSHTKTQPQIGHHTPDGTQRDISTRTNNENRNPRNSNLLNNNCSPTSIFLHTSRWAPGKLYTAVVQYHKRPMDLKHNTRLPYQFLSLHPSETIPGSSGSFHVQGTGSDLIRRSSGLTEQISHNSSPSSPRARFLQQCICSPKEGWGMETYNQPSEAKPVHPLSPLQVGKHSEFERCFDKRRFACQDRFKGCVSYSSHGRQSSEISLISMARRDLVAPAVLQAPLHYRGLQRLRSSALRLPI